MEPKGGFPNEIKTKIRYLIICCYWVGAPAPTQQFWKTLGGITPNNAPAGPQAPLHYTGVYPLFTCPFFGNNLPQNLVQHA